MLKSPLFRPFLVVFGLFLTSVGGCTALQSAKQPSAEEALEGLKTACVVADLTPNLPSEASKACDLIKKISIEADSDVQ